VCGNCPDHPGCMCAQTVIRGSHLDDTVGLHCREKGSLVALIELRTAMVQPNARSNPPPSEWRGKQESRGGREGGEGRGIAHAYGMPAVTLERLELAGK